MSAELLIRLPDYFPSLIDAMQDGFVLRGSDGTIIEVNRAFCEMTGFERSEIIGRRPPYPWWPEEEYHTLQDVFDRYLSGEAAENDLIYARKNGERFPVLITSSPLCDAEGRIIAYIGTLKDMTERVRAEEEQRFLSNATRILASSLDYRATLTTVAELAVPRIADWCTVHVVDADGSVDQVVVAHVNPAKVAWARELQERYPFDRDAPAGVPKVLRTGEPEIYPVITDEQLQAVARDPEHLEILRTVGLSSAMIVPTIARGRVLGAITLVSAESGRRYDANSVKLAEELAGRAAVAIDNARLYREAQQAARARDQFLAVAAHELRTPLTSMKGFAQLLVRRAERMPEGDRWRQPLQTIDVQVNRVAELVNRLLDVSRIEDRGLQLQVTVDDVADVVRSAALEVQHATEQHDIVVNVGDQPLVAAFDRTRIEQVLSNLLDNAIKYSPSGTVIEARAWEEANEIVVAVRDEGPGIPEETRPRLFERFFRGAHSTRAASEGLGLGLYVAHGIIEAHGGRMWAESNAGQGATFYFTLPRPSQTSSGNTVADETEADGE